MRSAVAFPSTSGRELSGHVFKPLLVSKHWIPCVTSPPATYTSSAGWDGGVESCAPTGQHWDAAKKPVLSSMRKSRPCRWQITPHFGPGVVLAVGVGFGEAVVVGVGVIVGGGVGVGVGLRVGVGVPWKRWNVPGAILKYDVSMAFAAQQTKA